MKMQSAKVVFISILSVCGMFFSCSTGKGLSRHDSAPRQKEIGTVPSEPGGRWQLAIGQVMDSATNLSRGFALYELFRKNPLTIGTEVLFPAMVDYTFDAPYGVSGVCGKSGMRFRIYKNGIKVDEIVTGNSWQAVYVALGRAITGNQQLALPRRFQSVGEGVMDNVDARTIKDCFPGSMEIPIPFASQVDTFRHYARVRFYRSGSPYENNKNLYGKYSIYNDRKLFFFRNDNIPYNLKNAARPLVFPLYKSLIPCLTYLSNGRILAEGHAYRAALNSYYSALISANSVIASPYERAMVRQVTYKDISNAERQLSSSRKYSAELFQLGADLNEIYLRSPEAAQKRSDYYNNIRQISDLCAKAEDKAKEIRGQKRLGGFLAAISYAGALSTTSAFDNTASDAYMSQAQTYLTTSMDQADAVSKELTDQFKDIDDRIDASSFIATDGAKMEIGKPFLAGDTYYFLSSCPELVKPVLFSYAVGKPRLQDLLNKFYADGHSSASLNQIFMHVAEIEARVINAEVRNIPVTDLAISKF